MPFRHVRENANSAREIRPLTVAAACVSIGVGAAVVSAPSIPITVCAVLVVGSLGLYALSRIGPRLWSPVTLVALSYAATTFAGLFGAGGPFRPGELGNTLILANGIAVMSFVVGYLVGPRLSSPRLSGLLPRVRSEGLLYAPELVKGVLIVAAFGAAYRFREGIPLFSSIDQTRLAEHSGTANLVAAVAYSLTFLAFLLLMPRLFDPARGSRRPWGELFAVLALVGLEGNRRFVVLGLCALLYAVATGIRLPPGKTFLAAIGILLAFTAFGTLRLTQTSSQRYNYDQSLRSMDYSGPLWLAAGYVALRSSADLTVSVIEDSSIADSPDRPKPTTLAGPLSYLPGRDESPDYWFRETVAPNYDLNSGVAIPLVASLYLDGSWFLVGAGFLLLGLISGWCRRKAASPMAALVGVVVTSGTILGVYGTFLGTPQYFYAYVGLAAVGLASAGLYRPTPDSGRWVHEGA
jgi:hypothetical protein